MTVEQITEKKPFWTWKIIQRKDMSFGLLSLAVTKVTSDCFVCGKRKINDWEYICYCIQDSIHTFLLCLLKIIIIMRVREREKERKRERLKSKFSLLDLSFYFDFVLFCGLRGGKSRKWGLLFLLFYPFRNPC